MKRTISSVLAIIILLCLSACSGNFAKIDLKEPIAIPQNGIIEKSVFEKIKKENAIATFSGVSDDFKYEWKVFGSELKEARDVNLSVSLKKTEKGIKIKFCETEDFGFSALLSVHLKEKWTVNNAAAYVGENLVYSVSVTGSKTSILNISVEKFISEVEVRPVEEITSNSEEAFQDSSENDSSDRKESTQSTDSKVDNTSSNKPTKDSKPVSSNNDSIGTRDYSDGKDTKKDKYETDPVPEGKPLPVEPEEQEVDKKKTYTCIFSIECSTILNNLSDLDPDKRELVPSNGVILAPTKVTFYEGESVFDVLQRVCKENGIHMESSWTPIYNSAYIEGIHNLYEFDCGELSGWMYCVDGWYPNYGCSRYQLADGEVVEWRYTCDLGKDVGCEWMGQ